MHGVWVNGGQVADANGLLPNAPRAGELLTRFSRLTRAGAVIGRIAP